MKTLRTIPVLTCSLALALVLGCGTASFDHTSDATAASCENAAVARPRNVILFIGDGMSVSQRMVAEEFARKTEGRTLAMNHLPHLSLTRTCSANSLITDSAAAVTAIACGVKTDNHRLGVGPDGQLVDSDGKPIESCAVLAKRAGRKVGIVTTVAITHATPGGFYAHYASRADTESIVNDLVKSDFDLFAGGGLDVNEKKSMAYATVIANGYRIVRSPSEFQNLRPGCGKILTRFTNGPLDYAIDRKGTVAATQPTLAEIVRKSIELLDNEKGFFLMVEGGRIDWAGHANDPGTNVREVLAMSEAVDVALAFQEKNPDDTLVIVTGDHETGGFSMGVSEKGYDLPIENLTNQTVSAGRFDRALAERLVRSSRKDTPFDDVKPLIAEAFGFSFAPGEKGTLLLNTNDALQVTRAFEHDRELFVQQVTENRAYDDVRKYVLGSICTEIISRHSGLGWTSGSHTGQPVITNAKGPGAVLFDGLNDNTDISKIIKGFYR